MAKRPQSDLESTKQLMGALLRQPPKQHEQMKVGKKPKVRAKVRSKLKKR